MRWRALRPSPLVATIAILTAAGFSHAGPCTDYASFSLPLGGTDFGPFDQCLIDGSVAHTLQSGRITIYDISDPFAPRVLSRVGANLVSLARSGELLFAAEASRLHVFDTSDLEEPVLLGSLDLPGGLEVREIAAAGNVCYLLVPRYLWTVDAEDPSRPVIAGLLPTLPADHVECADDVLMVYGDRVALFDLSDPLHPAFASRTADGLVQDVFKRESLLYTADASAGVRVVDVSDIASPRVLDLLEIPWRAVSVSADEEYLYAATHAFGAFAFSLADPEHPVLSGVVPLAGTTRAIHALGRKIPGEEGPVRIAYADGNSIEVVGFPEQVAAPQPRGVLDTPGDAVEVIVSGGLAYVADAHSGVHIVSVDDPCRPVILGTVETPGSARSVAVAGGIACVADSLAGLQVVDVSDPRAPVLRGTVDTPGQALAVDFVPPYAYVADGTHGVCVVELRDTEPVLRGSTKTAWYSDRIVARWPYVYATLRANWFQVIDVHDPWKPIVVNTITTHYAPDGISIRDDRLFVPMSVGEAGPQSEIVIYDLTDPASPEELETWPLQHRGRSMVMSGSRLYVSGDILGIQVFERHHPDPPEFITAGPVPGTTRSLAPIGMSLLLASGEAGLHVMPLHCKGLPQPEALETSRRGAHPLITITAAPQPARGEVTLRVLRFAGDLAAGASPPVEIFDVAGRLVRTLELGPSASAEGEVRWDGRDNAGHDAPSGLYFARLRDDGAAGAARIVLLRR